MGEPLQQELAQSRIVARGHAVEARVYAENPAKNFLPGPPGVLTEFRLPQGEGIRVDTGYREGNKVTPFYDPMITKVVAHLSARIVELAHLRRRFGYR
jgi:acetyl-CoA carboxylase biotin carboxylase subunit